MGKAGAGRSPTRHNPCGHPLTKHACLLLVLLLSGILLFIALAEPKALPAHPYFSGLPPFLVIAHRGGRGLGPEGTLSLFRQAVGLGADVLELDVRQSADWTLVVLHDERVDRTTEGSGREIGRAHV